MRILRDEKGSVTIYLVIVFFAMVIFLGLLIDIGRIKIAQSQLRRASNAAARSVAADYNPDIKNAYGLYILDQPGSDKRAEYEKYLQANLSASPVQNFFFHDYQYESIDCVQLKNLQDKYVLKQQILEEMKYRAPVDLTVDIIGRIKMLAKLFKVADDSSKDTDHLESIDSSLQQISENNKRIKELAEKRQVLKNRLSDLKSQDPPDPAAIEAVQDQIDANLRETERLHSKNNDLRDKIGDEYTEIKRDKSSADFNVNTPQDASIDEIITETENEQAAVIDNYKKAVDAYLEQALNQLSTDDPPPPLGENLDANNPENKGALNDIYIKSKSGIPGDVIPSGAASTEGGLIDGLQKLGELYKKISAENFLISFRDEIFINEFVLNERNDSLRFENLASTGCKKSEAEEIICGGKAAAVSEVWTMRFILDTPAYYLFVFKGAGPLFGGIASAVMGIIQASYDTVRLLKNERVYIAEVFPKESNKLARINSVDLKLDYADHLRIIALTIFGQTEDAKLAKIAEVIGKKSNIDMNTTSTTVFGKTTVSIRLWFLPLAGIGNMENGPLGTVIRNGRCEITKDVMYGY